MDDTLLALARVNPVFFPFLSGIGISISTNIVVGLAMGDTLHVMYGTLLVSSTLLFASGLVFTLVAWRHGPLHAASFGKTDRQVLDHLRLVDADDKARLYSTLWWGLIAASAFGLAGLILLLLCLPR
jgi:hypothetical protein